MVVGTKWGEQKLRNGNSTSSPRWRRKGKGLQIGVMTNTHKSAHMWICVPAVPPLLLLPPCIILYSCCFVFLRATTPAKRLSPFCSPTSHISFGEEESKKQEWEWREGGKAVRRRGGGGGGGED